MKKGLQEEINEVLHRMNFDPSKSLTEGFMEKYEKGVKNITSKIVISEDSRKNDHRENMHHDHAENLSGRTHHLGDHPAYPKSSDGQHFEEKLGYKRFYDTLVKAKSALGVDDIQPQHMMEGMMLVQEIMKIESFQNQNYNIQKELEELAVKLVKKEFQLKDGLIDFEAMMTRDIDSSDFRDEPEEDDYEPDSTEDAEELKDEIKKFQLVQAMQQGASKKGHYMYHIMADELDKLQKKAIEASGGRFTEFTPLEDYLRTREGTPRLVDLYSRVMPIADLMYWMVPGDAISAGGGMQTAGKMEIKMPKEEGDKPKVVAKAWIFPVLVHELIKGVFEIMNTHALPEETKRAQHVINQTATLKNEKWDLMLGPALWELLLEIMDDEAFGIKYRVYHKIIKLPVKEFNSLKREVFAGTPKGKREIENMAKELKGKYTEYDAEQALEKSNPELPPSDNIDIDDVDLSDLGF